MKQGLYIFGFFFIIMGLSACFDEPDYAAEPVITGIEDFYFVDVPGGFDTLVMRVNFQDGDGNLGLTARDEESFEQYILPLPTDEHGELIKYDPSQGPFNCNKYAWPKGINPLVIDGNTITDTVRADQNPLVRNFEITIFTREQNGEYVAIDFGDPAICRAPLGGRFSPLKEDFSNTKPLVGTIQFSAPSLQFRSLFRNDSLRLGVVIRDRTGYESNMAITEAFTLNDITRQED
ncbi:MAG: hypothetical protein RIG62_27775 [Cyclobacteriaceae bacterium]